MVIWQDELEGANDAKYARENPDKELGTVAPRTPIPTPRSSGGGGRRWEPKARPCSKALFQNKTKVAKFMLCVLHTTEELDIGLCLRGSA